MKVYVAMNRILREDLGRHCDLFKYFSRSPSRSDKMPYAQHNCPQADKNLEKRVYALQSGTAIVTHSRSKKERRFARVSRFFALSFHFLSVKTAKTTSFER